MNEKKKKPVYKKWWVWAIAVFIILGIALSPSDQEKVSQKEETPKTEKTAAAKTKKAESLDSKIKKAADPHFGKITSIEINDDMGKNDGGKIVLVRVKQDGLTKRTADYNTTKALKEVFKNDKVNEITYFWEATLTDNKGNESVDTVAKIQMTKDTASTINWDNFSYTKLDQVADLYDSLPALK